MGNEELALYYSTLKHENSHFANKFDINMADVNKEMTLLGIGKKTAEKIIVQREKLGQYNAQRS